jgi:acetoin utilization protein AcuB
MGNLVSEIMNRPVSEIMSTKLITVIPTDPLEKVKEIFETYNIHHILVVRHLELVGMISKTDFYKAIHGARLENAESAATENAVIFSKFKAEDLMTKHVAKISPSDKIGTAAEIFLENLFHAIPVVNDEKELKGIVSTYDIMKLFFHEAYPNQELKKIV